MAIQNNPSKQLYLRPRFPCQNPSCPRTFARASDARRHEKEVHQDLVKYICRFAECAFKGFKRAYLLRDHLNTFHHSAASGSRSFDVTPTASTQSTPNRGGEEERVYTFIAGRFSNLGSPHETSSSPLASDDASPTWTSPSDSGDSSPLVPHSGAIPIFDHCIGSFIWIYPENYSWSNDGLVAPGL